MANGSTRTSAPSSIGPVPIFLIAATALAFWGAMLLVAPNSMMAFCYLAALVLGVGIIAYPRLGVYLIAFLLIGQWPFSLFRYLGMLTIVASFGSLVLSGKRVLPGNAILLPIGFFAVAVLFSAVRPQTRVDLPMQTLAYIANCALVWVLLVMIEGRKMILHVVRIVILSGIVTGIIGLVQWRTHFIWMTSTTANVLQFNQKVFKGQSGFELQQWQGQFRIDSIVGTPDYLPLYMQTIAPFVAIMLIRQKRWAGRVALFSVLSLFAACHLLSYTRGALITTAVTAVFAGWVIDRRRFLIYGPILALACAVALVGWSPWRTRLATIFDLKHKESADTVNTGAWRLDAIPVGLGIIAERPLFGVGVGQGKWNWPESAIGTLIPDPEAVEPPPFHNDYLGIGVEMGLTGLVIFLTLLATTIRQLQRLRTTFQQRGDQELADVSTALLIAMVGLMAAMMLYPLVGSFRYVWLIFGLSGALVRYADQTTAATLNA